MAYLVLAQPEDDAAEAPQPLCGPRPQILDVIGREVDEERLVAAVGEGAGLLSKSFGRVPELLELVDLTLKVLLLVEHDGEGLKAQWDHSKVQREEVVAGGVQAPLAWFRLQARFELR